MRLNDGRPVIDPMSRYVVTYEDGIADRAIMLGDLILESPDPDDLAYSMPSCWSTDITLTRQAFADYCRRHRL